MELKKAILLAKQKIANSVDDPGGVQEFSSGGVERLVCLLGAIPGARQGPSPGPRFCYWRRRTLEIFVLGDDRAAYKVVSQSQLLPSLDIALLERCVAIRSWQQARRTFRADLAAFLDP